MERNDRSVDRLNNAIRGHWWSQGFAAQKELILIAESNQVLRRNLVDVLRDQYYRIMEAGDGAEAVRIGAHCRREIHLLMTSVRLPDLLGWELGELLRLDHPAAAIVYIAHTREDWWHLGSKRLKSVLLQIPFHPEGVLEAVRQGLRTHRELNSKLRLVSVQR